MYKTLILLGTIATLTLSPLTANANTATAQGTVGAQVVSPDSLIICIDLDRDGTEETCKSAKEWGGHTGR